MSDEIAVIQLYLGWGTQSDLWHGGPIACADTGLSAELIRDLDAWATECYSRINASINDGAPSDAHLELLPQGIAIAREIAAQLGHGFSVEVDDMAGGDKLLIHSEDLPTNPDAAAAMASRVQAVAQRRREHDRVVADAQARGQALEWTAASPESAQT